jgi:hypothetical protein
MGDASDFGAHLDELSAKVGHGKLTGTVTFDTPYAEVQHEGGWIDFLGHEGPKKILHHPGGGHPKFLQNPLFANANAYLQHLADAVPDGDLRLAMEENMDDLLAKSVAEAPRETGHLAESASRDVDG